MFRFSNSHSTDDNKKNKLVSVASKYVFLTKAF